jgi:CheY-like chemotaxis protein
MATIVVADDDAYNRLLVATLLEASDHIVLEAASGEEALSLAREHTPDLVIVDLHMPGMHGVDLIQRLRGDAKTSHVKIIIYTATASNQMMSDFSQAFLVNATLPKPSEPNEILRIVHATLDSLAGPGP